MDRQIDIYSRVFDILILGVQNGTLRINYTVMCDYSENYGRKSTS